MFWTQNKEKIDILGGYPNLMCFGQNLSNCLLLDSCPDYEECKKQYKINWLRLFEIDDIKD